MAVKYTVASLPSRHWSGRFVLGIFSLGLLAAMGANNGRSTPVKRTGDAKFKQSLRGEEKLRHALDRLTFGARPGDLTRLKAEGLKHWINNQLHPETVPENPDLSARLAPLETLRLDAGEMYRRYPSPQMVLAVAKGRQPLPEDPQERLILQNLVQRYRQREEGSDKSGNDSDSDLRKPLSKVLSDAQIERVSNGKPEEKRAVLASIPADKYQSFLWTLSQGQWRKLEPFAPLALKRQLMLADNPQRVVAADLSDAKIVRAVYSTHQLQELLVDFWFNHFNIFLDKGADHYLVPSYERDAIRPHVLGKFYDLLLATAKSPAMLFYLDNWESVGADSPRAQTGKNRHGLNENYGRELLELHTLGVDGGYTQQDVVEVARCFTGWTIAKPHKSGEFEYDDRMHDKGRKVVLGHEIPAGGGMNDGLEVLNILAHHPATAHFLSLQLAKRFVADDPPAALVARMAHTFLSKDGDLREVMRTMIQSPEFWSAGAYQAKVKTPFEMVVSAVRASGAETDSALSLANEIGKLGEPLYRKLEPTGYSNANAEWVNSAGLLERMNFAIALAHNRIGGVHVDTAAWEDETRAGPLKLAHSLLDADPSFPTKQAIQKAIDNPELQKQLAKNAHAGPPQLAGLVAGLTLGSPDFQKH